ncbi:MAG: hypothetical protein ACLRPC_01585 [Streptococcus sp.]
MNTKILEEFDSLDSDFLSTVAGGGVKYYIYGTASSFRWSEWLGILP